MNQLSADTITQLLLKQLREELSESEQLTLSAWVAEDENREQLIVGLNNPETLQALMVDYFRREVEMEVKLTAALPQVQAYSNTEESANDIKVTKPAHRVHFLKTAWLRYAAAVLIVFGIGGYLWITNQNKKTDSSPVAVTEPVPVKDIAPGGQRAVLTLANGSTITLDSAANGRLAEENGSNVTKKDGQVIYDVKGAEVQSTVVTYNTLSTPKGGQYEVRLPDGTHVWLNAASSITYPTAFIGKERRVKITGEVFFHVTKQSGKAFIVETRQDAILVTGTQFNVNAYEDEGNVRTALLEGAVHINNKTLRPGQAYSNGKITQTNIQQDVAWRNGFFQFENADLTTVMRQLARWYDIDVKYEGAIEPRTFEGKLPKTLTLLQVLRLLKTMNVDFTLTGNTLTVQ